MVIDELVKVAPPPRYPKASGTKEQWPEVELSVGTELPPDYKDLINLYGAGGFLNSLSVATPFNDDNTLASPDNLSFYLDLLLKTYEEMHERFPEECPFPPYPQADGLFPIAGDDNANTIFWKTSGRPENWTIVIYDDDFFCWEHYDLPLTGFLYSWLSGQLQDSKILINNPILRPPVFC